MTQEEKNIAAQKAGYKNYCKGKDGGDIPRSFTTEGERWAFIVGWWCGPPVTLKSPVQK